MAVSDLFFKLRFSMLPIATAFAQYNVIYCRVAGWIGGPVAARTKTDDSLAKANYRYRVTNWAEYDRALVNRGNLTLWFDEDGVAKTWTPPRPVGRGKPGLTRTWQSRPA